MKPLISIIVPVYNVQDYVLKCLNSLVEQSYDSIEIIVVDDGKIVEIEEFLAREGKARCEYLRPNEKFFQIAIR